MDNITLIKILINTPNTLQFISILKKYRLPLKKSKYC